MKRFILFVLVVAVCVYGLYRWTEGRAPQQQSAEKFTPAEGPKLGDEDVHVLQAMENEYTSIVQAVVPSVVSIIATKHVQQQPVQDPFELFFRRRLRVPQTQTEQSLGSGVIVSKEGHILTNHHVIADVDDVRVRMADGQEVPARIIGSDAALDIAVLKVTGVKVTPLAFVPDSDQVKVGQRVIAVGNPFGLDETVTQGIISAKGRAIEDSASDFFQTDAAINQGNSGGPLVDIHGEIIGINAAIFSNGSTGNWQGLGFAIPANTARRALNAIIKNGRVPHGYLGVMVATPEVAQRMNLADIDGAYIIGVTPGSPAEKAGIHNGDVITSIGQRRIHTFSELRTQIAGIETGATVPVGLTRSGKAITVNATITEPPEDRTAAAATPKNRSAPPTQQPAPPRPAPAQTSSALLAGIHVMEIPPDHEQDLPAGAHGVMISDVDPASPASGAVQQSDVIEEIDRVPIHSLAEYNQVAASVSGNVALLSICRDRRRTFAVVRSP